MERNDTQGNILDVKGVCATFRIGKAEVYRLIATGALPVMRFGKHGRTFRFLMDDLLKLRERSEPCTVKGNAQGAKFGRLR
jgi:hypothetical protein